MSDAARLLESIRDAAGRGDDLAAALRQSGVPGGVRAADRLDAGMDLPAAVAGLVPPRLAVLLGGTLPPLATLAALCADEAWRAAERRRLVAHHLAYPLASCALVAVIAVALARLLPPGPWYGPLASSSVALPPALLALLVAAAPWLPRSWHLPGSGWIRHLDLAERWARAGLAVRWRLTEAQARAILGVDLDGFGGVLGQRGAEAHCATLARWHQRSALRRLAWTARIAAALMLAAGGGLVLGAARMWSGGG